MENTIRSTISKLKMTRCYFDLVFFFISLFTVLAWCIVGHLLLYKAALTFFNKAWILILIPIWFISFLLLRVTIPLVHIVRTIYICFKIQFRQIYMRIIFVVLTALIVILLPKFNPSVGNSFTRGLLVKIKKDVNLEKIQAWLQEIDFEDIEKKGGKAMRLPKDIESYSSSDLKLVDAFSGDIYPRSILIDVVNNKKCVRFSWGGPLMGHFGLVVGISKEESTVHSKNDRMTEISQNAFVWSNLKGRLK